MSPSTIRVLVVDDYEPFRRLVCSTVGKVPALQIVGEASDGLEAVRRAEELKPDLVLLDIGLPELNGIEAARRIHKLSPEFCSPHRFQPVRGLADDLQWRRGWKAGHDRR